jgi:hypothetical protein
MKLTELWSPIPVELLSEHDLGNGNTYLWVYHPRVGFFVKPGRYAQHGKLFGDDVFYNEENVEKGIYFDDYDRGYFKVFPALKTIAFMPTYARERFEFNMKVEFEKEFPNWKIIMLDDQDLYYEPEDQFKIFLEKVIILFIRTLDAANDNKPEYQKIYFNELKSTIRKSISKSPYGGTVKISSKGRIIDVLLADGIRYSIVVPYRLDSDMFSSDFNIFLSSTGV